jgi:hypothetical protein
MNSRFLAVLFMLGAFLTGCSVAALPCRVTGAVVKVIPVVGDPAGETLEACGDAID